MPAPNCSPQPDLLTLADELCAEARARKAAWPHVHVELRAGAELGYVVTRGEGAAVAMLPQLAEQLRDAALTLNVELVDFESPSRVVAQDLVLLLVRSAEAAEHADTQAQQQGAALFTAHAQTNSLREQLASERAASQALREQLAAVTNRQLRMLRMVDERASEQAIAEQLRAAVGGETSPLSLVQG